MEVCVVMVIVAVFIALMANVVPHKVTKKSTAEAHGRFECYYEGSNLYQQLFVEQSSEPRVKIKTTGLHKGDRYTYTYKDASGTEKTVAACEFEPPSWAKYMVVDAVGGGAGGKSGVIGGEGQFSSSFFASVHKKYLAVPGKGGAYNNNGADTKVIGNGVEIITANGGKSRGSIENTTINDVLRCTVTDYVKDNPSFDCQTYPTCEIKDGLIVVNFCRTQDLYKEATFTYKGFKKNGDIIMDNPRYIVNSVKAKDGKPITELKNDGNKDTWIYHDVTLFTDYDDSTNPVPNDWPISTANERVPSLFTLELQMNLSPIEDGKAASNLASFIEGMKYTSKMKDAKVGNGGTATGAGNAGGVLFLW